jgi:type II secretory pathway component HofQ
MKACRFVLWIGIALVGGWVMNPVQAQEANPLAGLHVPVADDPVARALALKLKSMVVDKIDYSGLDIAGVLQTLAAKSKELDPDKKGINFILVDPTVHRAVTLKLEDVPMDAVLDLIGQQTGLRFSIEAYAVTCRP